METTKRLPRTEHRVENASFLLVCLSLMDALFTDFGLRLGTIEEANILMNTIYETNILLFYAIKIGLPLLLLYLTTIIHLKIYVRLLLSSALFLYVAVMFLHVFWMILSHLY